MKYKFEKFAVLAFAGMSVGGVFAATVVHDAGYDLAVNSASRAVCTNVYGGVWSFLRSSALNGKRTLLPAVRTWADPNRKDIGDQPFVMERGLAKSPDSFPCIAVNPTAVQDDNTFMRGAAFPTIPPGQVSCHPGEVADAGNQCVILRFTMPRDGEYALTVKTWHQDVGKAGVALLVNGQADAKGRIVSQGPADGQDIVTNDFSVAAANYRAGDFVELAVDGDGTCNANAMGLCFRVVETVEEVVDASDAFCQNLSEPTPANPFTTAVGTWCGISKYADTTWHNSDLVTGYERTSQGGGLKGVGARTSADAAFSAPWIVVNGSDDYVSEFTSGKSSFHQGCAVAPFEMVCHPGAVSSVSYRLTPTTSGNYDIGLTIRDVTCADVKNAQVGVDVLLMQGGWILAQHTVSVEDCLPGVASGESICIRNVPVEAGIPIEVDVCSRTANAADATAFRLALIRRGDFAPIDGRPGYDANAAMKANMMSATPSTKWTYNGAEWSIGILKSTIAGAFSLYTTQANPRYNGLAKGFGNNKTSSPYAFVNVAGRTLVASDGVETGNLPIERDAIFTHPAATGGYPSTIRLKVPETGVYRATARFKDIAYTGDGTGQWSHYEFGAIGYVLANGCVADSAAFVSEYFCSGKTYAPSADIEIGDLYLQKDSILDFVVAPGASQPSDLTAVFAWAEKVDVAKRIASFDIDGHKDGESAPATYDAAGRIGFSGRAWTSLKAENGAASASSPDRIKDNAGASTHVRLSLSRRNGAIVATAANIIDASHKASDLFRDCVISSGSGDVYDFTVSGLCSGQTYTFLFYSRMLTSSSQPSTNKRGTFTIGGVSDESSRQWFTTAYGDYARLTAVADGKGCVTGTFASSSEGGSASWCGLQVCGDGFKVPGMVLLLK